jgi:hypothetical protein
MYPVRNTSAAEAEWLVGWQRRAEALLHPVTGCGFHLVAGYNFQILPLPECSFLSPLESNG